MPPAAHVKLPKASKFNHHLPDHSPFTSVAMVSTRRSAAVSNVPPPPPKTPPQKRRGKGKVNKKAAEQDVPETRATDIEDAAMADVTMTDGVRIPSGGGQKSGSDSRSKGASKRKLDETESEAEEASEAPTGDIRSDDDEQMSELSSLDELEPPVELTPKPASKPPKKRARETSPSVTMVNTTQHSGASKGKQISVGGPAGAGLSFKVNAADLAAWMNAPMASATKATSDVPSGSDVRGSTSSKAHSTVPPGSSHRASRIAPSDMSSSLPLKNAQVGSATQPSSGPPRTKAVPPRPFAKPSRPSQNTAFDSAKPEIKKKKGRKGAVESDNEEPERVAALESPPKGSARPTSTHVIHIKEEPASPTKPSINVVEPTPRKIDQVSNKLRDNKRGRKERKEASESENDRSSDVEIVENPAQTLKPPRSRNESRSRSRSRSPSLSPSPSTSRGSKTWRLEDIPEPAQSRWKVDMLPILLRFQGARRNPWTFTDPLSIKSLQMMWDAVYGDDVPHRVVAGDCVHGFANQCLYNWRSSIRAAAESVVGTFFHENQGMHTLENRAAFSTRILQDKRYLFEKPFDPENKRLFRSNFFLTVLACHLDVTKNAADVPGLFDGKTVKADCPIGAWGLAAAALERIFKLFANLLMRPPVNKQGKPTHGLWVVIAQVNPQTGKKSKSQTQFCEQRFSSRTTFFISAADSMTSSRFNGVLSAAEGFMGLKRMLQDTVLDDAQNDGEEEPLQDGDSD